MGELRGLPRVRVSAWRRARPLQAPDLVVQCCDEARSGAAVLVDRARDTVDQRRAYHRGIGDPGDRGRLLRGADAEANSDRQAGVAAQARHRLPDQVDHRRTDAGDPRHRDVVDEAAGVAEHLGQAAIVGRRRRHADEAQVLRQRRQAELVVLLGRQIDDDQAIHAGGLRLVEEALGAVVVDRVVVAHQHEGRLGVAPAKAAHEVQRAGKRHAGLERAEAAGLDAGPSAIGSVNGMPISIRSAPASRRPAISSAEVCKSGSPAHR